MVGRWMGRLPARELDGFALLLALCGFMAPAFMLPSGLALLVVAEVAGRRRSEAGFTRVEIPAALVGVIYTVFGAGTFVGVAGSPDWVQLGRLATVLAFAFIIWLVVALVMRVTARFDR